MAVDLGVSVEPSADEPVPAAETPGARELPDWIRRTGFHLGVIALFTVPATALWWRAWAGGPGSSVRCACLDPGQQVWFIAWPAYALSHALDPFFTHWLWPPHGVNLLSNASSPLVGLVLSPVTWIFGPFVATTLALTLAPGLSAWGCWVACRRFVSWQPACWIAGFLFGYSPFVVQNVAQGHLSFGLLVLPPLILVVLHEILVRQQWSPMRCGLALAALLFLQFFISAEMLTVTLVVAAVGIVIAAILTPRRVTPALPFALRAFAIAGLASVVLLALPAWEMLKGPQHIKGSIWSGQQVLFTARLYRLWNPGSYHAPLWPGSLAGPAVEFLGFGVLVLFLASLAIAWRRRSLWILAGVAIVSTVLSWGSIIWLSPGHYFRSGLLPWSHFTNAPVLEDISPFNFAALAALAAVIVIAIGLDTLRWSGLGQQLRSAGRFVVIVAVVAVAAVPVWLTYGAPLTVQGIGLPPWYATAALHIREGSVVTSYPFPASASITSQPMVWQAADGMRFRLAGGYVKVPAAGGKTGVIGMGPPDSATRTLDQLTDGSDLRRSGFGLKADQLTNLRAALLNWGTSYVVVVNQGLAIGAAAVFTAATGEVPEISHRAWVWDLSAHPLGTSYSGEAASRALSACSRNEIWLGATGPGHSLPQVVNRCIAPLV